MLLIIGNSTDRLPNILHIASHAQLQLLVADNRSALATALSTSRRNVVLYDEDEINEGLVAALAMRAGEPNLRILVLCRRQAPQQHTQKLFLKLRNRVEWLPANVDLDALAERVRALRNAMLMIQKAELEAAIENNEFLVQYQPKVRWVADESRWQTSEVEALIRWRHPAYGLTGPQFFLPEAEQFGLMGAITEHVLRATLAQLKRWEESGLLLGASINLAAGLLSEADLALRYARVVDELGFKTERVTFELPVGEISSAERTAGLANLREAGFKIALDGFGTHSDWQQVFGSVEFDEIKLHASVLGERSGNESVTKSLIALTKMAHNLNIDVCAEGVETEEMFEFLSEIHCDKMQGYLVSEAVMPEIIQQHYANEMIGGADDGSAAYAHLM